MTPQEERKEVAENLRKNADAHKGMPLLLNVAFAAFGDDTRDLMEETVTSQMAAHRLADLIDPVCEDFGGQEGTNGEGYDFACSACGWCGDVCGPSYCPNCGARVVSCND